MAGYRDNPPPQQSYVVQQAVKALLALAQKLKPEDLAQAYSALAFSVERYDANRWLQTIEGLQAVIHKNGGIEPVTWLPTLYKKQK